MHQIILSAVAGEAHVRYNSTQTKATSLDKLTTFIGNKIEQLEKSFCDYVIDKTLEGYGY